jgi:hypothetical protein
MGQWSLEGSLVSGAWRDHGSVELEGIMGQWSLEGHDSLDDSFDKSLSPAWTTASIQLYHNLSLYLQ